MLNINLKCWAMTVGLTISFLGVNSVWAGSTVQKKIRPANRKIATSFESGGVESSRRFISSCRIDTESDVASGTLIGPSQLIVAGHSNIDPRDPKARVICRCGETQAQGFTEIRPQSTLKHPDFISADSNKLRPGSNSAVIRIQTDEFSERDFSDVQIINLPTSARLSCDGSAVTLQPAEIVPSMEKSEELLKNADCFFAGSGKSDFRVVHVPRQYVRTETPDGKRSVLYYINDQTPKGMSYLVEHRVDEMQAAKIDRQIIKDEREKALAEIESVKKRVQMDREFGNNAYLAGDSGGSLFCTDPVSKKDYLMGVTTNRQQDVILLAQPGMKGWLERVVH